MKIKIQNFALSLFLLLFIASVTLWSVSLLFTIDTLNVNSAKLYRDSWQLQLQQSQLTQRLWLQQRLTEVSDWMRQNPHAEQRLRFINEYYQRYAQIRLIQIHPADSEPAMPQLALTLCFDEHGHKASAEFSTFDAKRAGLHVEPATGRSHFRPARTAFRSSATAHSYRLLCLFK